MTDTKELDNIIEKKKKEVSDLTGRVAELQNNFSAYEKMVETMKSEIDWLSNLLWWLKNLQEVKAMLSKIQEEIISASEILEWIKSEIAKGTKLLDKKRIEVDEYVAQQHGILEQKIKKIDDYEARVKENTDKQINEAERAKKDADTSVSELRKIEISIDTKRKEDDKVLLDIIDAIKKNEKILQHTLESESNAKINIAEDKEILKKNEAVVSTIWALKQEVDKDQSDLLIISKKVKIQQETLDKKIEDNAKSLKNNEATLLQVQIAKDDLSLAVKKVSDREALCKKKEEKLMFKEMELNSKEKLLADKELQQKGDEVRLGSLKRELVLKWFIDKEEKNATG